MQPNPYWDTIQEIGYYRTTENIRIVGDGSVNTDLIETREELVRKYSWTIPSPDALDFVAEHTDTEIIDPMAGTGYWASLLEENYGKTVHTYDIHPPQVGSTKNQWHQDTPSFRNIKREDAVQAVENHKDAQLFLSWPPYGSNVALEALKAYQGDTIILIDEKKWCATPELYEWLGKHFNIYEYHYPVRFEVIRDTIWVLFRDKRFKK